MHNDQMNSDIRNTVRLSVGIREFLESKKIYPAKSYGGRHVYKCPIHAGDNSPSFYVYEPEDSHDNFFCFGCKKWGDVVDLRSMMDRISIMDACSFFCEEKNISHLSRISEEDLLDTEIANWDSGERNNNDVKDFSVLCFSMAKLFRNMLKSKSISYENRLVFPIEVKNIMADFDKMVRNKDYDNAQRKYQELKSEFKDA